LTNETKEYKNTPDKIVMISLNNKGISFKKKAGEYNKIRFYHGGPWI